MSVSTARSVRSQTPVSSEAVWCSESATMRSGDGFVGMTTDWFAVWGQHKQAETNQNWRCGLPEDTWLRVKDTFFPVPGDALKPYPNYWLAGSPYGQCDVVSIDDESRVSDLSRYALVAFAGWNTATPEANAGHKLENLVYLRLRAYGDPLYYFVHEGDESECDFIRERRDGTFEAVQVAWSLTPKNEGLETAGLLHAMDRFGLHEGEIVTRSQSDIIQEGRRRIRVVPAHDFLSRPR